MEEINSTEVTDLATTVVPKDDTSSGNEWVYGIEVTLGIVGTVGNVFVCLIILRAKFLHNMTNYLILNLAVADMTASLCLIFNVFLVETSIVEPPSGVAVGEIYCRLYGNLHLFWVCVTASVFNLIVVTLERFYAIVYPLHYTRYFTTKRVTLLVALTWLGAFLQEFFALFINSYDAASGTCAYGFPNLASQIAVGLFVFLSSYFCPLCVMIWAYYKIMRNLKKSARNLMNQQTEDPAYGLLRARKKIVQVLFTVVMAFLILWTPNQVVYLFENFHVELVPTTHIVYSIFRMMAFSNSVVNPIIYAFKYKQFRKGFRVLMCSGCMANNVGAIQTELSNT
ncbi:muscarinic acetylcholine receptor M2-like [Acanthaster planci]|uniref:Muscarinic acetylcholine receptor M2-like n=1 Tax=Acanthaster planci TaxID=133434 RepID=A0A8B7YL79_ACAPL|nr:muscarinic acetylcholine receptor M2-like [Acanthaster planci]XP_022094014.1 muscarinic acetylcholine receptor M2-like [Acanthaster planci]XP_022094016.1 muscarinic acetylcholine receptor M2-like [Acanthaster planci]